MTSDKLSVGFLNRGVTRAILKSEGTQPVVRDEVSEEWEKVSRDGQEEGMGSSWQVVGQPNLTSCRMSSGERGHRGQGVG